MKRLLFSVALCFFGYFSYGQVGIGNTDPKSSLDISASNVATPSSTDGILIPRIDDFPASDPGADQDGMLVFVTGNGVPSEGFYYWDQGTSGWVSVGGSSSDADWYEVGTSNPADDISDNIFHLGNIVVGGNLTSSTSPLLVQGDVSTDLANILTSVNGAFPSGTYFGISNSGSLTGAGNYTGISNSLAGSNDGTIRGISNSMLNSGTGQKIGIENTFNSADGVRKGFRNYFSTGNSISMGLENVAPGAFAITGTLYGVKNDLSSDGAGQRYGVQTVINSSGTGAKYGEHILINSSAGGQHYGVYSDVQKASGYAGYFLGRLSLGTATTNRYLMPATDGTAGQTITTDGSGQLSFSDPVQEDVDWYEIGSTTAPNSINDDMFTQGNVVIGATTNPANVKFYVESDPASNTIGFRQSMAAATSGLLKGIDNLLVVNGTANVYAVSNSISGNSTGTSIQAIRNSFSGNGGTKTGMFNSFGAGFGGSARGSHNEFNSTSITGAIGNYNFFNSIGAAATATGTLNSASSSVSAASLFGTSTTFIGPTVSGSAYGNYANIQTSGTDYGVYAQVADNGADYAGYFIGRMSLGNAAINRYLMPASDGTSGQVITTDGSGQLSFTTQVNEWSDGGAYISPVDGTTKEVLIGTTTSSDGKLLVNGNGKNAAIETDLDGTNNYGIYNRRDSGGAALKYGVYNDIGGNNSTWSAWGTYNNVTASGNGSRIGTYNIVNSTGTGNKYATWNYIPSSDPGTHYGILSDVQNASGYAGYFVGRTSLGNTSANRYLMPATDGSSGQVITTDGSGNLSFQAVPLDGTGTDDQTIDNFGLLGNTLGLSLEDDGQAVQTVDLSNVDFNVSNFAVAKMNLSANQTLTLPTYTKVNFDTAAFDLGSNFNTSTDRFEVSETGVYRISATIHSFSASAAGPSVELLIYVNGSSVKRHISTHPTTGVIHRNVETIANLNAGQYIEVYISSSVNFTLNSGNDLSTFEVERIR